MSTHAPDIFYCFCLLSQLQPNESWEIQFQQWRFGVAIWIKGVCSTECLSHWLSFWPEKKHFCPPMDCALSEWVWRLEFIHSFVQDTEKDIHFVWSLITACICSESWSVIDLRMTRLRFCIYQVNSAHTEAVSKFLRVTRLVWRGLETKDPLYTSFTWTCQKKYFSERVQELDWCWQCILAQLAWFSSSSHVFSLRAWPRD